MHRVADFRPPASAKRYMIKDDQPRLAVLYIARTLLRCDVDV
jgi:hypothetical protein